MNYLTPKEIVEANINGAVKKSQLPLYKMIILGIFAGMCIGIGSEASNLTVHTVSDVGIARTLAGCIFPVGLMIIIVLGFELFTGNCTMVAGVMDGKVKFGGMLKNLVVVYFSNFIGGVMIALMCYYCNQYNYSGGTLGAYTIKVAYGKATMSFSAAIISGILCNVLVCLAVLLATAAKDIAGKILSCFFVILVFVISGFEHCVANMYYLSSGYIASKNTAYLEKAAELCKTDTQTIVNALNPGNMITSNLIPVTIGNIIGGMVFVALPLYICYIYEKKSK